MLKRMCPSVLPNNNTQICYWKEQIIVSIALKHHLSHTDFSLNQPTEQPRFSLSLTAEVTPLSKDVSNRTQRHSAVCTFKDMLSHCSFLPTVLYENTIFWWRTFLAPSWVALLSSYGHIHCVFNASPCVSNGVALPKVEKWSSFSTLKKYLSSPPSQLS